MTLQVTVQKATNLPNVDRFGKSDPFCVLLLQGHKEKTKVIDDNLDPVWDEKFEFQVAGGLSPAEVLKIEVYDHELVGRNRVLGTLDLQLREVVQKGRMSVNTSLRSASGELVPQAKLQLELVYTAPPSTGGGGGGGGGGGATTAAANADVDAGGDGDGGGGDIGDNGIVAGDEGGEEGEGGALALGTDPSSVSANVKEARNKARQRSAARSRLPDKPLDFQVRVHVIEARKLIGGQLNATVKIVCGGDIKESATKKGSNNPFWDQMLYFHFKDRPQAVFDQVLEIKVLNAKVVLKDALIGSFKMDVGTVYDEPEHCFIHKWLLLTDPNDPSAGAKGYLKVSINVIGPGDDPKPSPSTASQENVDIESNLLRPSGVSLQAGSMVVRIFRAEDMPQMDPGYFEGVKKLLHVGTVQKELVDPYCTVNFAGHTGKTEVIWNEQDPIWNHQVNLGIRFPSMCERIRLQLKDKDKLGADDYIGTCFLNLSEISASGEDGFLPTFGPCFINVYGSPREFSDLPDKFDHLNKGLIPGVSYRGRVMVEVDVTLGELPATKQEPIKTSDIERATNFLRRRKYKLYAALDSATAVQPVDAAVEFEISIGNYGNKLDTNAPPQASTTQPTNPVYDGNAFYFLPWMDTKPCVVVDSMWEDSTYRIEALNMLVFTLDRLEGGLNHEKYLAQEDDVIIDNLKQLICRTLSDFSEDLVKNIKWLDETPLPQYFTKLDKLTKDRRTQELKYLLGEVNKVLTTDVSLVELVGETEDYVARLCLLTTEPQNAIPDVVIWMISGNKRIASCRIPANSLMFSETSRCRGNMCGKFQTIFLTPPGVEKLQDLEEQKGGAQLRLLLWLGLEQFQSEWTKEAIGGSIAVYAETYENQACFVKWGTTGVTRPDWSDAKGKVKQPKEAFVVPDGWKWDGDWFINPELSIAFEADEGLNEWQEDIYENQMRAPFSSWPNDPTKCYWSDVRGDKLVVQENEKDAKELTRDDMKPPEGWRWSGDWKVDKNRACDEEGWEYSIEPGLSGYAPFERNVHLCRRRRWVITRLRLTDPKALEKKTQKRKKAIEDGWEYARLANLSYHLTDHSLDLARRRRWHRKMVALNAGKPAVFYFEGEKKKKDKKKGDEGADSEDGNAQVPRLYLVFKDHHKYQLRAYLYQARDMYSADKTGLSDPYCVLGFGRYSARSRVVKESICPTWDQTILIDQIKLFGDPTSIRESPPKILLNFFDKDTIGKDEFIGKVVCEPVVRFSTKDPAPRLDWYPIDRYTKTEGECLAAFELFLDEGGDLPFQPPSAPLPARHFIVPSGIRPILQKTRIEVLCWGVRDMKRFQLLHVESPYVELECGGTVVQTKNIQKVSRNPNFPDPVVTFDVLLPKEQLYAPPLNIRIVDKRAFGRTPMVGTHIIKSVKSFFTEPHAVQQHNKILSAMVVKSMTPQLQQTQDTQSMRGSIGGKETSPVKYVEDITDAPIAADPDASKGSGFDWWTKYYYSIGDDQRTQEEYVGEGHDKMEVYSHELEEAFNNFTDLAQNFPLFRGKGSRDPNDPEGQVVGVFKGSVKVYPLPDDGSPMPDRIFSNIPSSSPVECVVRVYIVKGIALQPQDPDGKSDPYIKIKIGKNTINDKENFIPSNLDPLFGKMFEIPITLPTDHTLTVNVMDYDYTSADDLIGTTTIDLENRYLSHHRALCGIPQSYYKQGTNKWRDSALPKEILKEYCLTMNMAEPQWVTSTEVVVDGTTYTLKQFEGENSEKAPHMDTDEEGKKSKVHPDLGADDQRLALHILRERKLVPEHIETRTLYNPLQPGISQGKLHMWVDIFPKTGANIPPPIDISPRKPEKYYLRIVVWNTKDVLLDEVSVATGEAMSDIYVKGWLRGQDETQKTDTHFRSLDGEGNFNWRFVYEFDYLAAEKVVVIKKKEHFYSLDKSETHLAPVLTMQVWDNDLFSPDDFIGTVDLNLLAMAEPARDASVCSVDQLPELGKPDVKLVNLFEQKRLKGWWPVFTEEEGVRELTGKFELEMEVVTEEEHNVKPAGKARDEPNLNPKLDPPNRPATSFLWFTSPWKTFKHIVWKHYKMWIIGAVLVLFLVIFIVIFVYTAPSTIMQTIVQGILPS